MWVSSPPAVGACHDGVALSAPFCAGSGAGTLAGSAFTGSGSALMAGAAGAGLDAGSSS